MQKPLSIILFLFFSITIYAQFDKIIFDHYGLKEGFNSREAMNIITTSNGMVWVSSNDGLARFDGKRFKFYQHISGDSNSLSNNYCKAMQTDKRGQIWIASSKDLDVFNPGSGKFIHIKTTDNNKEKQPVYPVCFYYDSTKDIMWVGTARGLYFSKNGSMTLQSVAALTTEKILASSLIGTISAEGNGILWVTSWRDIIKLNTKNGDIEKYELPEKVDNVFNDKKKINFRSSYFDNNKTLWLGAWLTGLVEFNTITKTFRQYCFRDYKKEQNTIYHITKTGLVELENILWLSTDGVGLMAFDIQQKKFTSYAASLGNDPYGIKGTTYGLFTDRDKAMWIGSATGLHRYDYSKQLFKKIDLSNIEKRSELLSVSLMEMQQNKQGLDEIIWLYVAFRGGYLYNLREKKIMQVPAKIAAYINMPTQVLSFYIDTKNILWISSVEYGLTGYNIDKDEIVFTDDKLFREKWKWASIFYEDSKKRLWIGTYHGLYLMDSSRKNIAAAETVNNELQKKELALAIQGITEDEAGNIWFTSDNTDKKIACVGKLNPLNNQLQIFYNEKVQQAINHNPVDLRSIASDGRGKIFVTFFTEGIAWFNSKGNDTAPHFLRTENGLNSSWIDELLADKNGNIWCSTSFGLSCYKPAQNTFTNYSYISYALDNTAAPPLYLSPQSGNMYVGQSNAMLWFNTAIKISGVEKGRLVFSEINVLNKIYNPGGKSFVDGDVIRLNHRQDMISIEFALLNYTNAADNTYSWMLKGWDKEWVSSKNNIATYANLKPGNYTLLVKAANSQGNWIEEPVQLGIKIKPPFYQTWWFIILSILAVTGIVYWLVQQRINRIKERYRLRNKIASDLHDEIGSTLTSINILSNVSQQAMELQPLQAKEMLQQISTQSKNIQQSMSDIVWSIRPDNEKIEHLVVRMREFAAQTLEPLNIDTSIAADESLIDKILPMHYRKDILLIYKEAINNIAKHANATTAKILLTKGKNNIILTIADNGKWKGNNSGTGTKTMQERANAIGGQLTIANTEAGTQILLTIPVIPN